MKDPKNWFAQFQSWAFFSEFKSVGNVQRQNRCWLSIFWFYIFFIFWYQYWCIPSTNFLMTCLISSCIILPKLWLPLIYFVNCIRFYVFAALGTKSVMEGSRDCLLLNCTFEITIMSHFPNGFHFECCIDGFEEFFFFFFLHPSTLLYVYNELTNIYLKLCQMILHLFI